MLLKSLVFALSLADAPADASEQASMSGSVAGTLEGVDGRSFQRAVLDNGIRVTALHDSSADEVHVVLLLDVDIADEGPGEAGFSQLVVGRSSLPAWSLPPDSGKSSSGPRALAQGAAGSSGEGPRAMWGAAEVVAISHRVPRASLDLTLWGLGEQLLQLARDADELADIQRRQWIESWPLQRSRALSSSRANFLQQLLAGTRYERAPRAAFTDVESAGSEQIANFLRRVIRSDRLVLAVVGPVAKLPVIQWAHDGLARLPAAGYGGQDPRPGSFGDQPVPGRMRREHPSVWTEPDVSSTGSEAKVPTASSVGWLTVPAAHDDALYLELAAHVLSARARSHGLRCAFHHRSLRYAGFMELRAELDKTKAGASAVAELQRAMALVLAEKVRQIELDWARATAARALERRLASFSGRAHAVALGEAIHGRPEAAFQRGAQLEQANLERLHGVIERYLGPGTATVDSVPSPSPLGRSGVHSNGTVAAVRSR